MGAEEHSDALLFKAQNEVPNLARACRIHPSRRLGSPLPDLPGTILPPRQEKPAPGVPAPYQSPEPRTASRRYALSRSYSVRATTFVARRKSSSTMCSSARFAFDSSTVRGPAP